MTCHLCRMTSISTTLKSVLIFKTDGAMILKLNFQLVMSGVGLQPPLGGYPVRQLAPRQILPQKVVSFELWK